VAVCGAESGILREIDHKYLESFEIWCWIRTEISWTDGVSNEVLQRIRDVRNILGAIKRRKANWIGHILRRNCLLKHVSEGKIERSLEVTGRRVRRRKQLLADLKEKRGYWKLKEKALVHTLRGTLLGRGC
jgi:hypothetical protein